MSEPSYVEIIAAACHHQNRAYSLGLGEPLMPHWSDAPQWQKRSVVAGVTATLAGATPAQNHQNWLELRLSEGWIYGDVKDVAAKMTPYLVPYERLSEKHRLKDTLFHDLVHEMAALLQIDA